MIFVNHKAETEKLQQFIQNELEIKCIALHGSKT